MLTKSQFLQRAERLTADCWETKKKGNERCKWRV